jgi:aarF domain-containing kinase
MLIIAQSPYNNEPFAYQHPGNMLVYRDPDTKQAKLVLLDHGLYRTIPNNYRLAYCQLWRALLSADYTMLQQAAFNLNVPRFADMISILFTGRVISSPSSQPSYSKELTKEERRAAHKQLAKGYTINDVFYFLENVPRELLLIFRVSHMVNNIHRQLGAWKGERFEIYANYATRGFWCETREELYKQPAHRTGWKSRWYLFGGTPNLKRSLQYLREVIAMRIRLFIAETVLLALEWWNGGVAELDIVDKAVEDKLQTSPGF